MAIPDDKRAWRDRALAERARVAAGSGPGAGLALAERVAEAAARLGMAPGAPVAGYWPIGDEIDVRPLLDRLRAAGHPSLLPQVVGPGEPLLFRLWEGGAAALEPGPHRTRHPATSAPAMTPAIILVPLLAFDADGFRLGWGGGYYDRTLARLRATSTVLAVGAAFAGQWVERLPREPFDEPLDWIATEQGVIPGRDAASRQGKGRS